MPLDTTKTDFIRNLFDEAIAGYGRVRMADIDQKKRARASQIFNENMLNSMSPKTVTSTVPDLNTLPPGVQGAGIPNASGGTTEYTGRTKQVTQQVQPSPNDVFSAYANTRSKLTAEGLDTSNLDTTVGMYSRLQPKQDMSVTLEDDLRAGRITPDEYMRYKHGDRGMSQYQRESLDLRRDALAKRGLSDLRNYQKFQQLERDEKALQQQIAQRYPDIDLEKVLAGVAEIPRTEKGGKAVSKQKKVIERDANGNPVLDENGVPKMVIADNPDYKLAQPDPLLNKWIGLVASKQKFLEQIGEPYEDVIAGAKTKYAKKQPQSGLPQPLSGETKEQYIERIKGLGYTISE